MRSDVSGENVAAADARAVGQGLAPAVSPARRGAHVSPRDGTLYSEHVYRVSRHAVIHECSIRSA